MAASTKKQLYVVMDDACYVRITTRQNWTDQREITEDDALTHLSPAGVEKVYAGNEHRFTPADQSFRELRRLFAE